VLADDTGQDVDRELPSTLPDMPTSKEGGLPEFQALTWFALFAPKGTSPSILDRLTQALDRALDDGTVRQRLVDIGGAVPETTGEYSSRSPPWSRASLRVGRQSRLSQPRLPGSCPDFSATFTTIACDDSSLTVA
jgi:Tripartite tricarboxylate transporter family receptor